MDCQKYTKDAIEKVNELAEEDGNLLHKSVKGKIPMTKDYHLDIDVSKEFKDLNTYQQLIGILIWAYELGRVYILDEVSVLSHNLCNPREGHLDAVFQILNYLNEKSKYISGKLGLDDLEHPPYIFPIKGASTENKDWMDFYPDAEDRLPSQMPEPLGRKVRIRAYVDADHAGNLLNRRLHSGIIIYVKNVTILWYSKRHNKVEASSFGSEFVDLRIAVEMIENLRYKLCCFKVDIYGPDEVLCDKKYVVKNSSVHESVLSKHHNIIFYHRVREVKSCGITTVQWIPLDNDLADFLSKTKITGE